MVNYMILGLTTSHPSFTLPDRGDTSPMNASTERWAGHYQAARDVMDDVPEEQLFLVLAADNDPSYLQALVSAALAEGWKLHGNLAMRGALWSQTVYRERGEL